MSPKPTSTSPLLRESGASQERLDCEIVVIGYNSAQYIDDLLDSLPAATRGLAPAVPSSIITLRMARSPRCGPGLM